ncbi:sugar transferase [Ferrimonas pelagia]|uniref:Glycosyltransferase n=1 Tax=Ferrimonas pelagia TaxID=1177826 RepID=A0ABP9FID3_9GAMM
MTVFWVLLAAVMGHLVLYPLWMGWLGRRPCNDTQCWADTPAVTLWIPVYNDAAVLEQKLRSVLAQDYRGPLSVVVCLDGCADDSQAIVADLQHDFAQRGRALRVLDHRTNRGKLYRLNQQIARQRDPILILSDCSAWLPAQCVTAVVDGLAQPGRGVVTASYGHSADQGQSSYWRLLNGIRRGESQLGAAMGGTGALLAFRKAALAPLPPGTINDDFVAVLQAMGRGYRAALLPDLCVQDLNRNDGGQFAKQRRRIGAGNLAQLPLLWSLLPRMTWPQRIVALLGKGLRALLPLIALMMFVSTGISAFTAQAPEWAMLLTGAQVLFYGLPHVVRVPGPWRVFSLGLQHSLVGQLAYLSGWRPAWMGGTQEFQPFVVRQSKRLLDIVAASLLLAVTLPLWPLVALAIRLDSPGPILYRQMRVGRASADFIRLFWLLKFRTMSVDNDAIALGWTQKNDPRITRVGRWLRATRLDELPQLLNVLKGEMSMVGPRPERPAICGQLEQQLPFYQERTYEVQPGLTGLAQIHQAGDTSLSDVQTKLFYDHAYAASLSGLGSYLRMEGWIALKTAYVVFTAKGH